MGHKRASRRRARGASRVDTRLQILLFVEGRRTEAGYFTHYYRIYRHKVIITISDFKGGPAQLVERAITAKRDEQRQERRGGGKAHDEIWCVFDVDEHPGREEAMQRAVGHGIEVVVSNPCLELWFVLHFADQTAYLDSRQAGRRAEQLLHCGKTLTNDALESLVSRYEHAMKRAKRLDEKHFKDGSPKRSNPSSDVWRLIERITS